MIPGGEIDYATTLGNAVDQLATGLDHVLKALADDSLSTLDQARFIGVMCKTSSRRGTGSR